MDLFSEIKQRVSMRELLEYYGIREERNGFILCQFHTEKTPSAKIYNEYFHCFGCGISLDIFAFVSQYEGISLYEALKRIDSVFSLGLVDKNDFDSFDKLTYSIRKKEQETAKLRDYAIIGKAKPNTLMKQETELKKMKENLFKYHSRDIDLFFGRMEARLCNMKNLQRNS